MSTEIVAAENKVAAELSVADVRAQVNKVQELMKSIMQKDVHYGVIPGTGKKPSLLKAGAEKLCFTFRFSAEFSVQKTDLPNEHREYEVICTLRNAGGGLVAQGVGSCSTMEKKYRIRKDWKTGETSENQDLADTYNTVLKMAKKRAHVDATITACSASDIFTQDVEDMPQAGEAAGHKQAASHQPSPQPTADELASPAELVAVEAEIMDAADCGYITIDAANAAVRELKAKRTIKYVEQVRARIDAKRIEAEQKDADLRAQEEELAR